MKKTAAVLSMAACLLLAPGLAAAAGSPWTVQTTRNVTGAVLTDLAAVSCPTTGYCVAVGSAIKSTDRGSTPPVIEIWRNDRWRFVDAATLTNATNIALTDLSCPARTSCVAVGHFNRAGRTHPLAERWNGSSWSRLSMPALSGPAQLDAVSCHGSSACTAVGSHLDRNGIYTRTLAERWNGHAWSVQSMPTVKRARLQDVSCATVTSCVAVGDHGTQTTHVLAERWNGTRWSRQAIKDPSATGSAGGDLTGVSCTGASNCWAVGYSTAAGNAFRTLIEHLKGGTWSIVASPHPGRIAGMQAVSCVSRSNCTAVGSPQPVENDAVNAERWNGSRWTTQALRTPTGENYLDLSGLSCVRSSCTAVGKYTKNNGARWLTLAEHR